jgi:CheY-like chemotaxis protein
VILMDINLPGISGIDAPKMLRQDPSTARIPVVALSEEGLEQEFNSLDAQREAAEAFIQSQRREVSPSSGVTAIPEQKETLIVQNHIKE